jgi:hypothetical protein
LEGGMEGLQEWRVGGGIWSSMQNVGLFRGPAEIGFLHKTSKFWSRAPYKGSHWSCSKLQPSLMLSNVRTELVVINWSHMNQVAAGPTKFYLRNYQITKELPNY